MQNGAEEVFVWFGSPGLNTEIAAITTFDEWLNRLFSEHKLKGEEIQRYWRRVAFSSWIICKERCLTVIAGRWLQSRNAILDTDGVIAKYEVIPCKEDKISEEDEDRKSREGEEFLGEALGPAEENKLGCSCESI